MNYEIKNSKTEKPVPVIDGVHLHSIYDPEREATNFVNSNREQLETKNNFLVLGLGFGYHVEKMEEFLRTNGTTDFRIMVIEPYSKVVDDYKRIKPVTLSSNTRIVTAKNIYEFFHSKDVVNFLLESPGMIAHPASFNHYKDFFTRFLKFEAQTDVNGLIAGINNETIKQYLEERCNTNWNELVHDINLSTKFNSPQDYLMLALSSLTGTEVSRQEDI
ncbi:MAG: hypothetical protein KC493_03330 [Bacteriovoracaceae bacterium]|nr:hypothetical protein [Bacteriovoracaceae bacterium]